MIFLQLCIVLVSSSVAASQTVGSIQPSSSMTSVSSSVAVSQTVASIQPSSSMTSVSSSVAASQTVATTQPSSSSQTVATTQTSSSMTTVSVSGNQNLATQIDISSVNQLSQEDFIDRFGNLVELTPLCAAAVLSNRPFQSLNDLYRNLCEFIDALPRNGRAGILRCYSDLAGRFAKASRAISEESTREQASAGLGGLTEQEMQIIDSYNRSYRQKFGFTFVICARLNNKETIINGLKTRVTNDLDTELNTGIEEVKKIMLLPLKDLVE